MNPIKSQQKRLFAPPITGTERLIWYADRWWKWKQGISGTLRIKPDGRMRYRKPSTTELRLFNLALRLEAKRKKA